MKNILVAINFDESAKIVLDKAAEIAKAFDSHLWLLHITQPAPDFVGFEPGPKYIRDGRAAILKEEREELQGFSKKLQEKGIESESLLIKGATVEMILEKSKKLNIDLIVMGHQEHNFLYRALFGSISKETLKNSKVPILVVPYE